MAIERTLVQVRERSMLDLLDLSLVVVRKRPVTIGLAALLGIAPFYALNLWLFQISGEAGRNSLPLILWMFEAPIATAPLTFVLGGLMFGQRPTFFKVISAMFRSSMGLIVVHGFLRYVLFFFIPTRLAFANSVLLLERGKWWKILGRGGDLSNGRGGELFVLSMAQFLLTYVFSLIFYLGVSRIIKVFVSESLTFEPPSEMDVDSWRFQVPIWIVVAFFAVVKFLTYIDQRIRLEGWEVELRLREVGTTLEEARRW